MTAPDPAEFSRRLAADSLASDDATGWFERLYHAAENGETAVPWDRGAPHPLLVEWAAGRPVGPGRALVVGAGLGFDAEFVAGLGLATTAFDISPTAIGAARRRNPGSPVTYVVADLLDPPPEWAAAFDVVVESLTVQALPDRIRASAIAAVSGFVAPGGTLLVIAAARDDADRPDGPPWPLTRREIGEFGSGELELVRIERLPSPLERSASRWRAEFRRLGHIGQT
ncbi:MAG: methyltransferase type 12 [Pseudonocardiales bacterium]|nr:methyltransferase type 12 [Pseudonocardiales bacterium]